MKKFLACLPILAGLILLPAVSHAKSGEPAKKAGKSANDFYRKLMKKQVATNEDVIRAVARFKGYHGGDNSGDEIKYLQTVGVRVDRNMPLHPRRPATKGAAANMFLNAMKSAADQRGLMGRIFTGSRRYAARDGMAQKLIAGDSLYHEFMTGGELMGMLGRAVNQMGDKQ